MQYLTIIFVEGLFYIKDNSCKFPVWNIILTTNTPGTAGGPGGRDRTLAVKSRKNVRKITFFS